MIEEKIAAARQRLKDHPHEPGIALEFVRGSREVEDAGLTNLVETLACGRWGIHKHDVLGVLDLLEKHLAR